MQYCPHCMNPATAEVCPNCGGQVRWQAPSNQLPVGTLLRSTGGHVYQIGAAKGQGGFGITYAALDLMNQSRVAIKEYFPSRCASRDNVTRVISATGQQDSFAGGLRSFLEEGKMLSAVGALESVVSVRDFFEANGTAYIVMEYVDGIPLHEVVRRKGRMSRDELFAILPVLLRDIGILHRAGVIHRDISPDNLILTKSGKLKLLDFGSARSVESGKTMTVMLKAGFSPVEQYQSKGQGPYTDVYALAGTIYYCLTGVVPPTAIDRISADELKLPNSLGAGLTAQQQDALVWGMTVQPQARPQNMEAFTNALFPGSVQPSVAPGQTPGYTGQTPGHSGQTPGYTGQTPGYTGQYTGQGPGYTGQTPGYTGQTAQKQKGFGKGLFIGIGAAAIVVVLLVAGLLLSGVLGGNKKSEPSRKTETQMQTPTTAPAVLPGNNGGSGYEEKTTDDGYTYRIENGEAVITGYSGTAAFLSMPDTLDGCNVTVLGEGCLAGNTVVESVLLPLECKEIRANAFYGCTNLRDVNCYSTAQADPSAFTGCLRLRAVKRMSDDSVSSWKLPSDCRIFVSGTETGVGGLSTMEVDDNGVIYGITDTDNVAIMDVPAGMTYLSVPADLYGYPVLWVWEGALNYASEDLTIYMCPEMAFDPSLVYAAEWDCDTVNDFCYSWYLTCVLCDDINTERGGTVIVPDVQTARVARIRAEELPADFSYGRPDGSDWGDLMNEMGVEWDYATALNKKVDTNSSAFDSEFDAALLEIEEKFTGTHSSGGYYTGLGAAFYLDNSSGMLYIHAIGIL